MEIGRDEAFSEGDEEIRDVDEQKMMASGWNKVTKKKKKEKKEKKKKKKMEKEGKEKEKEKE
jgi:hypothetical protein